MLVWLAAVAPVINEVCYDPDGADAGAEFVEIINPDTCAVDLAGYRLEFANGAEGPAWTPRWQATGGDRIAAGGRFLVADTGWAGPAADAVVALGLQNGPDALRLVRADQSVDLVGWGDLAWPELSEGAPAPDVAGQSLARRPDGRDTGDNAADFLAAAPTPGERNWPGFAPRVAAIRWDPPSLAVAGRPVTAEVTVVNGGLADLVGAAVRLEVGAALAEATVPSLAPDSTAVLRLSLVPAPTGMLAASLAWRGAAAGDTLRSDLGRLQVGPAPVRLSEVMAAPAAGGEWCEIVNADVVPRSLAEFVLRDEDGAWRDLPDAVLAPGDCRLLAQDAGALAAWLAELAAAGAGLACDPAPPLAVAGWPSLNNTAPAGRAFADRLLLGLVDGTVLDHVTVGEGSGRAPAGRSLERGRDAAWRPATAPAGATPGCLPPARPDTPPGTVRLSPNPFSGRAGDGALHVDLTVPAGAVGWELRLYDLWGRLVRDLGGDDLGAGPRSTAWDGTDDAGEALPAGGYVAVVVWRLAGGGLALASRQLVVLREPRP